MSNTAVVTGAVTGLGAEVASILAGRGWNLVLLNRSRAKTEPLLARLCTESPNASVDVVEADLSDQDQILAAARQIAEQHPRLDGLFNTAGVLLGELTTSKHGNELHFQINTLAPYMLMRLLKAPLASSGHATVLNVSSGSMALTGRLKLNELRAPPKLRKLIGAYAQSKLALTTLTNALAPEFALSGTMLRSVDPGPSQTSMTAGSGMPSLLVLLRPLIFKPATHGGRMIVDAALNQHFGSQTGIYIEKGKTKRPPRDASDPTLQAQLLEMCRDLTGL